MEDLLENLLFSWTNSIYKDESFIFQQDSAPAHRAKVVQEWFRNKLPGFMSATEWHSYSLDLNPLDYSIWSYLETKACSTRHDSLDSLTLSLLKAWDEMPMDYVCATMDAFPRRLKAYVLPKGDRFKI
ncbi:unnamed protein product [Nippostrongylus brasiliensis]|uniref:DDE_3 domain-containing protein n=1 Tax=Nippostrongylus brasiliensis TaxID=27835 RepID=A0A0N4YES9_NIPBR|nr:unnamed protein product [Nippostrongylus brasiliensis]